MSSQETIQNAQKAADAEPRAVCALWRRAISKRKQAFSQVTLPRGPAVFREEYAAVAPRVPLRGCGGGFCNAPPGELGRRRGAGSGWLMAERRREAFIPPEFLRSAFKMFTFSLFEVIFFKLGVSNVFW